MNEMYINTLYKIHAMPLSASLITAQFSCMYVHHFLTVYSLQWQNIQRHDTLYLPGSLILLAASNVICFPLRWH